MPKVSVILVLYNSRKFLEPVFAALKKQTYQNTEIIAVINSEDGSKQFLQENYPEVRIIEPGSNIGFAGGNNLGIKESTGDLIQLVNPDLILEDNYVEELAKAFADTKVAAATGKLLRYDFEKSEKTNIIDSTGIVISKSGRARDRGQLEVDSGQFDKEAEIFGVSGAGPMYRKSALEKVNFNGEYFDESFLAYWEDVDLSWRLNNAGFAQVYVPSAVAYHGRTAGQSKGGYLHLFNFIKHHRTISSNIKKLNYKNHILMYLKNAPSIHPAFILRELAMLGYVAVFETSTLKVVPELFRQLKQNKQKRIKSLNP